MTAPLVTDIAEVVLAAGPSVVSVTSGGSDVQTQAGPGQVAVMDSADSVVVGAGSFEVGEPVFVPPVLLSWQGRGFDQGASSALLAMSAVTDTACQIQFRIDGGDRRTYVTDTDTVEQTDPHGLVAFITNPLDRGVPLDLYWRWFKDGEASQAPFILLGIGVITVPLIGGAPTEDNG